ncbi:MAG: ribonuclease P protein component [Gammaproteobacteria bacterium]|nr:ribonuclease P protein component [Gammaproteobacteria bacterium]
MRFRRADRLTRKAEFDHVLTHGTVRATSGPFRAFAAQRADSGPEQPARLGLVVGKRQLRRAVDRNRIKRLVRESFRTREPGLPDLDIVVRLSRTPDAATNVAQALGELWVKLTRSAERDTSTREQTV